MPKNIDGRIARLDPEVELPSYAYAGDAGLDLRSNATVDIAPHERVLIPTGLAVAIPEGYAGFVQPRSGRALKEGLSMANTPGLIDSHAPSTSMPLTRSTSSGASVSHSSSSRRFPS